MKKFVSLILAVFIVSLIYVSCKKSTTSTAEQNQSIPQQVLNDIAAHGFSTKNVVAFKAGYLVEGDIYLTADDLKKKPASSPTLRIANTEQFRTYNLVTGLPRVITVSVSNLGQNYIDATDQAIARYNALNLRMTFQRITGNADINIQGFYEGPSNGFITLGSSGFPANGNPFNSITLNTHPQALGASPDVAKTTATIQHEIGHCIGFRHSDYMNRDFSCVYSDPGPHPETDPNNIGAVNIPGTPSTADPDSWMLACAGSTPRTFNYYDNIALQYLYGTPLCVGEGYKIVNGVCEKGVKRWTTSSHVGNRYYCYYTYEFSDGSTSGNYYVTSNFPCLNPL
ncbi:dual-action HEIGH metallo-peptidase [Chitinophaga dinghuensis]|uniref:Dual-action HEIGH metallo-peptidase n=1 Tax=Chitinophaga dinghuensis TaxID=1539050 RepID=A0A327VIZ4_9BACT|nr:M57 family metalloprotease [Chitinophaga dinghuensis]RAJ72789.1 dual-action HEIGH metallo-peptidase [Chitinophaga dinghuensis]